MSKSTKQPEKSAPRRRKKRAISRTKFLIFMLLPTVVPLIFAEIACRVFDLGEPQLHSTELPEQRYGIMRHDADLFWSLAPNIKIGVKIKELPNTMVTQTNSLGLRYPEIPAKEPGEYRILSLGESTTFGAYISNHETYSARLEQALDKADQSRRIRVINAGVSAWSSFQSLMYLKLRGLDLQPDMVLFYHEFNDYLPSSLRSSDNTEIGLARTDRELWESSRGFLHQLVQHSALVRFIVYQSAKSKVKKLRGDNSAKIAANIGLSAIGAAPKVEEDGGEIEVQHGALPRRVSSRERRQNFDDLRKLCVAKGIELIIIHPSYRFTRPHECILTGFCRQHKVTMFEAHDVLHPRNIPIDNVFIDTAHPTPGGHQRLADALAPVIQAEVDK